MPKARRGSIRLDKRAARLTEVKLRGRARVDVVLALALAAYDLVRLPKPLAASGMGRV